MDCRLHFKDVFFVSAPWYLQDKNTWPFSEEIRAIGRGQRHGRRSGGGGFVSIRSNGLSFLKCFYRESWESKDFCFQRRERKKLQQKLWKPLVWVLVLWMQNRLVEFLFPTMPLKCWPVHLHTVLCLAEALAQEKHGLPAKVLVCCAANIIFCVHSHNHRHLPNRHAGPLDLLFSGANRKCVFLFSWSPGSPHSVIMHG